MISPTEIQQQANNKYPAFLASLTTGEAFFPLEIRGLNVSSSLAFDRLNAGIASLVAQAKPQVFHSYTINFYIKSTKNNNIQHLPSRIFFETEDDYVHFLKKGDEVAAFKRDLQQLTAAFPLLQSWATAHSGKIVAYAGSWPGLIAVCSYFLQNLRPNLYIRQLPITIHTKFIESHIPILRLLLEELLPPDAINSDSTTFEQRFGLKVKEELIRLRFLDSALAPAPHLADIALPVSAFHQLSIQPRLCVITENEMNFLTLPPIPGGIAIWGKGFRISALEKCRWLSNTPIWYWGDIDTHGLLIFDQLKGYYPQTKPMLMDRQTLDTWYNRGEGKPTPIKALNHADSEMNALFLHLKETNKRLEQEQIPQYEVIAWLSQNLEISLFP